MQTVEFTLYEVFGYVFPGAAAMLGVYFAFWPFTFSPEQDWSSVSGWGWSALLAVAYVLGHLLQAVINLLDKVVKWRPAESEFSLTLWSAVCKRAHKVAGLDPSVSLSNEAVWNVADDVVLQRGKTETRDVYVYREGFYRGMALSFVVIAGGCLLNVFESSVRLRAFGVCLYLTPWAHVFIGLTALAMAYLFFRRYQRFLQYRKIHTVYSFLVISSDSATEAESPNA